MENAADRRIFTGALVGVVVLDFFTKLLAEAHLPHTIGRRVVGDWFQLRLVYNPGAAFGLDVGPYSRWVFFVVAIVAVGLLYRMSRNTPP